MDQTEEVQRRYWPIGEVARELGLTPSRIRFWLKVFNIEVGHRAGFKRQFTRKEFDTVRTVKYLVDDRGFTLKGARRELQRILEAGRIMSVR